MVWHSDSDALQATRVDLLEDRVHQRLVGAADGCLHARRGEVAFGVAARGFVLEQPRLDACAARVAEAGDDLVQGPRDCGLEENGHVFRTLQKAVTGAWIVSTMLSRCACGTKYWPTGMKGGSSNARRCMSSVTLRCAARSAASNQASFNASIFGFGVLPPSGRWLPGLVIQRPAQLTQNTFHAPFSVFSFAFQRLSIVPQSIDWYSTLRPMSFIIW